VLLVNPPRFQNIPVIREERCEITERYSVLPPYSLLQIAALLRKEGHQVLLIDANGKDIAYNELPHTLQALPYDALIFRFTPTTFDWDTQIAKLSKGLRPEAKTIGICYTLRILSEEVLAKAASLDIYVRHEYEVVVPKLIDALAGGTDLARVAGSSYRQAGSIVHNPDAQPLVDYDSLPMPAYDLLPGFRNYFVNTPAGKPFTMMYTSKGCPYSCIFCTVARTKWKKRSAQSILEELRYLKRNYGVKTVSFFDETFTIDRQRVVDIAQVIKEASLGIKWYCNTRVDLVDEELMQVMYRAGCRGISYGVESGSQEVLDNAKKGCTVDQAQNAVKWAKKAGIKVYCSFILGLPGETLETVRETLGFIKRVLPTSAQFNVAVPYPGTELYHIVYGDRAQPLSSWDSLYQHQAVIGTKAMSPHELDQARLSAYRTLYSNPRWWLHNIWHVFRHPDDFDLALRYVPKLVDNYFFHGMRHGH
jgi:radical SAM superfamily enzyme YgiQ (UPF0313 family)